MLQFFLNTSFTIKARIKTEIYLSDCLVRLKILVLHKLKTPRLEFKSVFRCTEIVFRNFIFITFYILIFNFVIVAFVL